MRVLIVGASGMIGRHLLRDIPMIAPAIEVIGTYNSHPLPQGIAMDITDVDSIARGIAESCGWPARRMSLRWNGRRT